MVVLNAFGELESCQVVRIERDLAFLNLLGDAGMYRQILNIVLTVRRVEHLWCIIWILLLRHAHVDTDVGVAESVILE